MKSNALAPILNCNKHSSSGIAHNLDKLFLKNMCAGQLPVKLLQSEDKELPSFSSYSPFHFNVCEVTIHVKVDFGKAGRS